MQSEVHLIVKVQDIPTSSTLIDYLSQPITSGDSFFFAAPNQSTFYTVGSKIELVDSNVAPEVVVFTRYVTAYDDATGEVTVSQPFDSNLSEAGIGIYVYTVTVTERYLDLFENESISQNWKFQDLTNFTSQGAFTREFRIPFSTTNQNALGPLFDVNISSGASNFFHYKLPAEIRVDTLPISSGYLRVRKVYKQSNRISEVEVAFYAETPDLVRNIGEKKLSDIAALTTLDEIVGYDNVINTSAARIWTILDRGQLWSEGSELNTRSLITASQPVYAADLTPALNWWWLFENIITEAGFQLQAGTLQNILSDYWMPWLNSQNPNTNSNPYFFQAYPSNDQPLGVLNPVFANTEVFDTSNVYNSTTYLFTAPLSGTYTFSGQVRLENGQVIPGTVFLYNKVNGGTPVVFQEIEVPGANAIGEQYNYSFSTSVFLDINDTFQLIIARSTIGSTNVVLVAGTGSFDSTIYQLNQIVPNYGTTLIYNLSAPDMKQIEFISDVIKMHNCAIVPDRTIPNKIAVVPQNSYLGSGSVLDWTSKLDTSKDITLSSTVELQKAKFQFTYTAGEELIAKPYRNVNRIYGDYEAVGYTINPDTMPSDFAIGDQKIQLVTRSTPSGVVNGSGYVMPMFFNDSLKFVAPGPRCLYEAGAVTIQLYNDSTNAPVLTSVPVLNNYSSVYAELNSSDLNWAPEVPPHFINANPYNNLFNLYWRTYMNALYSPEARIMEANFALDLKDILTFQFSDKVWIQDSFWRILEVTDYKVGDYESTRVKLLKFLEDVEDCASTPVSVSLNGEVNFENASGNPVEATQDCCQRYGYNWDETAGVCWAFGSNGTRPTSPTTGNVTNPAPRKNQSALRNADIANSIINGTDVTIEFGNNDMLAVGRDLELTKNVSGSNLLGKNVTTNLPGIHLGGGYRSGNVASSETGWSQSGVVHFHNKDSFASAGAKRALFIEGISGEHLEIPDATTWSCMLNLTIQEDTQTDIDIALLSFGLTKVGGVAYATPVTVISSDTFGTGFTYDIDFDVTTNTAQHRLVLTINGAPSFPVSIIATATLYYQQNKLA